MIGEKKKGFSHQLKQFFSWCDNVDSLFSLEEQGITMKYKKVVQ